MRGARSSPAKRTSTTTITTDSPAQEVVVAVDANGADLGPAEVAAGAALAAARGVRVLLFGPQRELRAGAELDAVQGSREAQRPRGAGGPGDAAGLRGAAGALGVDAPDVEIVDAPCSIAKSADPARAVRGAPEASIVQAARAVAEGRAQALVCAGGTGAAVAAGLFNIKRARGIHRPALALALPVPDSERAGRYRPVVLLDVGANAQARREHLVQFAYMGAALAEVILGVARPRVALLSNGEEAQRGSPLVLEAHAELAQRIGAHGPAGGPFELIGNVEGGDVVAGAADVIVTDGFTGNIALKLIEGVSQTMIAAIRAAAMSSPRAQLGGVLLRPALRAFRDQIDPEAQGGAYLLGLRSLGVVPHGRFTRQGFAEAIVRAQRGAREDLVGRTYAGLEQAGALRSVPVSSLGK
jgi:glycerol-3-phosphate acyltransferase PlsX